MQNKFMQAALNEARLASYQNEVPVGAVIVKDGEIIVSSHNLCEEKSNPLLHAEIIAISKALEKLGVSRLDGCDMYVTLEPCAMCCGAISNARLSRLYFGAYDKLFGGVVSATHIFESCGFAPEYYCGIMEDECSALITEFFKNLRK